MREHSKDKFENVIETLRDGIINGDYRPGYRLPSMSKISEDMGIAVSTVQRGLSRLAEDGYVVMGARRHGTFVAKNLPYLCNYGLVTSAKSQWSRMHMAIQRAADMCQNDTMRFYEYLTSSQAGHRKAITRLCRDILNRRVGGLIFTGSLTDIECTPILEQKTIPCVRGHSLPECDIPAVCMDLLESFPNRAVEYLTSKGCRRIAHLMITNENRPLQEIVQWLRKTGIEVRPYWVHSIYPQFTDETTANVVNVLMQLEGDKRPDALIIHDDNLIDHATAGLMAAGVRVPDDLEVLTHYNYPAPASTVLPMTRLGFDCRIFLRKCVELIEVQRQGGTPPPVTYIPAIFESELDT